MKLDAYFICCFALVLGGLCLVALSRIDDSLATIASASRVCQ